LPEVATGLSLIAGYLIGSIPTARLIAARYGHDPLVEGERSAGATNVWRLAGARAGLAVLIIDIAKGVGATFLGLAAGGWWAGCAALLLAMVGHALPPWSRFRGGRSVACLIGGGAVLAPLPFAVSLLLFGILVRPLRLWRAAVAGLLAYPILFGLVEPDRRRLVGVGFLYLVLAGAWTRNARRSPG